LGNRELADQRKSGRFWVLGDIGDSLDVSNVGYYIVYFYPKGFSQDLGRPFRRPRDLSKSH
jgi:hypothetical protein